MSVNDAGIVYHGSHTLSTRSFSSWSQENSIVLDVSIISDVSDYFRLFQLFQMILEKALLLFILPIFLFPNGLLEKEMATHSSIFSWRIPMDKGTWWATVHRVTKSWTQLKELNTHTRAHTRTHAFSTPSPHAILGPLLPWALTRMA